MPFRSLAFVFREVEPAAALRPVEADLALDLLEARADFLPVEASDLASAALVAGFSDARAVVLVRGVLDFALHDGLEALVEAFFFFRAWVVAFFFATFSCT